MRLVFAYGNGTGAVMLLDNHQNIIDSDKYFNYEILPPFNGNTYIRENFLTFDGFNYIAHSRVLGIRDFATTPQWNAHGSIEYFELIEVVPYVLNPQQIGLALYQVRHQGLNFPEVMRNWVLYSSYLQTTELNLANAQMYTAFAYQKSTIDELNRTKELYEQAQRQLESLQLSQRVKVASNPLQQTTDASKFTSIVEVEHHQDVNKEAESAHDSVQMPIINNSVIPAAPKTKRQQKLERWQKKKAEQQFASADLQSEPEVVQDKILLVEKAEIQLGSRYGKNPQECISPAMFNNVDSPKESGSPLLSSEELYKNEPVVIDVDKKIDILGLQIANHVDFVEIMQSLAELQDLIVDEQKDLLMSKLCKMPIDMCANLLAAQLNNNIKQLLLKKLISYNDADYATLSMQQQFIDIAMKVGNKELIKNVNYQLIRELINDLDFKEFFSFARENVRYMQYGLDCLLKRLGKVPLTKYSQLVQFFMLEEFELGLCLDTLANAQMSKHVRMAAMYKLQALTPEDYYLHEQKQDFSQLYFDLTIDGFDDFELKNMLNNKKQSSQQWFVEKTKEVFVTYGAKGSKLTDPWLSLFARQFVDGQTLLMVAIKKSLSVDKIRPLIKASDQLILTVDSNNQNIFHYLSKYFAVHNIALFKDVREAFESAAKKSNIDIVEAVNLRDNVNGNTYLHCLLEGKNEENVLQVLAQLFSSHENDEDYTNPFYLAMLLSNHAFESISVILDKKPQEWMRVRDMLYGYVSKLAIDFYDRFRSEICVSNEANFFHKSLQDDEIFALLKRKNFDRLIYVLESRHKLLEDLTSEFSRKIILRGIEASKDNQDIRADHKLKDVNNNSAKIFAYFDTPKGSEISCNNKSLFRCFAEFIVANNDSTLEKICLKSQFWDSNLDCINLTDTIQWVRARSIVSNKPLVERDIVNAANEIIKIMAANVKYALEFLKNAYDSSNSDVIAGVINYASQDDAVRIMGNICHMIAFKGSPSFVIIDNILNKLKPEVSCAFVLYLVNKSMELNNVDLIRHIVCVSKVVINSQHVTAALINSNPKNVAVLSYVVDKYVKGSDLSKEQFEIRVQSMYALIVSQYYSEFRIKFLLEQGYDPSSCDTYGHNVLVKLLLKIHEGDIFMELAKVLEIAKLLFSQPEYAKKIAKSKDGLYALLCLSPATKAEQFKALAELFDLFLQNDAGFADIDRCFGGTPIEFVVGIGSVDILNVIVKYISQKDLYYMLTNDSAGYDIIEFAETKHQEGELDDEFVARLKELLDESRPAAVPPAYVSPMLKMS